jgi:uroporphyrin-III C-methyltransferase
VSAGRLRIAVTGSAGVGKTTLVEALAPALGLPIVPEETRARLERGERPLSTLSPGDVAPAAEELWEDRRRSEAQLTSFVADNCSLDFAAYALHHGATDEVRMARLLEETRSACARYDAILLLPWGAIPYQRDGLRSDAPLPELRYQLVLESLLARHADPDRVHRLPAACTSREARLAWALERLAGLRARRADAPADRAGAARGGFVHLVGAGPGDPGLLTVRALQLLRTAEVVTHDELVPAPILALAGPQAELIPVGRRHHGSSRHPLRLHPAVLERAAAGQVVVRLKCGDPFVFGRGGEEAEELTEAGIPWDVVPGISAALGAAASAHIPLTHRELSSDVTFATGHDLVCSRASRSDWPKLAGGGTLVLYMASRALGPNLSRLVALGRPDSTPAAWIANATRPDEQVVTGTLGDLASKVEGAPGDGPALLVVGEVVSVRERLAALARGRP